MNGGTGSIWRDGGFHADEWIRYTPDSAILAGDYPLLVALGLFIAEPERFLAHEGPLGVEIAAGESAAPLQPYLGRLALLALTFPKFSDGRSYSTARLLRERMGFRGELSGLGDVLADQIPLMRRCGIQSFEVHHAPTRRALLADRLAEMHHYYQPIPTAPQEIPGGPRPWLRQPAE